MDKKIPCYLPLSKRRSVQGIKGMVSKPIIYVSTDTLQIGDYISVPYGTPETSENGAIEQNFLLCVVLCRHLNAHSNTLEYIIRPLTDEEAADYYKLKTGFDKWPGTTEEWEVFCKGLYE